MMKIGFRLLGFLLCISLFIGMIVPAFAEELRITQQPVDFVGEVGEIARFTVVAQGEGLTYEWYYRNPDTTTFKKLNATKATYSIELTEARNGRQMYCIVRDAYGASEQSDTVTMTIRIPLEITQQPEDCYVNAVGETVSVSVEAQGEGLTYQWYYKNANANSFSKSSITTATYRTAMRESYNGRQLYCVIADAYGNTVQSDTVTIGIRTPLEITQQPVDFWGAVGDTATFTVEAQGDGLQYSWYYRNPGATAFSKSNGKTASYSLELTSARNGREMYCVVSDAYGNSVQSATVTMTIRIPLEITRQPEDCYVSAVGELATVTVEAQGEGLTYQWYFKSPNASSFSKSSITKATYRTAMKESYNGRQLYCVIADAYGDTVQSDTVTIGIRIPLEITRQPEDCYVNALGETVSVSVEAQGEGLTYQWYFKSPNANSFSKSSITKATYRTAMKESYNGRQLYCVIADAYGDTVQSDTVTIGFCTPLEITQQPVNFVGALGDTAIFTVEAQGDGLQYSWYYRNPGATAFSKSNGKTASYSLELTSARNGREMYCVVSDAYGNSVQSDTVTMTIGEIPAGTFTVVFYDYDGSTVLATRTGIAPGGYAVPPTVPTKAGASFLGWSGKYANVTENSSVRAIYSDEKNVFVVTSGSGSLGDTVTVLVSLDGVVKTCGFDISLMYDDSLELVSFDDDLDLGVVVNPNAYPNGIKLNYSGTKDVVRQRDFLELTFRIKETTKSALPIWIDVNSIYQIVGNDAAVTTATTLDAVIRVN